MFSTAPDSDIADVLIVGGSYAGLSAALTFYRALHTAIVFDHRRPRNSYDSPIHLVPTWENQDPKSYFRASRAELQLANLSRFCDSQVERVTRLENGLFEALDATGSVCLGRKVLLSSGVEKTIPNIDGYRDNYPARMLVPLSLPPPF